MTVLERIKETARQKKNISITVLEQELGYSNGSLAKAKDIPSSRIAEISNFLGVSMEFLMTGEESKFSKDRAILEVQITKDEELMRRLKKYMTLPQEKKDLILAMIDNL